MFITYGYPHYRIKLSISFNFTQENSVYDATFLHEETFYHTREEAEEQIKKYERIKELLKNIPLANIHYTVEKMNSPPMPELLYDSNDE